MDVSFENKFESQYFQKEKLVLPTLPHIYTNIIKEMFDKDNLYKKNTLGKKQKKEPEYEENKLIPLNTIICSNSFSINNELHNNCNGEEKMSNDVDNMLKYYMDELNEKLDDSYETIEDSSLSHINITSSLANVDLAKVENEKNKKENNSPKNQSNNYHHYNKNYKYKYNKNKGTKAYRQNKNLKKFK